MSDFRFQHVDRKYFVVEKWIGDGEYEHKNLENAEGRREEIMRYTVANMEGKKQRYNLKMISDIPNEENWTESTQ